jgi:hypothetical protein
MFKAIAILAVLMISGCANWPVDVPAKYEVTDLNSGKKFVTYEHSAKSVTPGAYNFTDASGQGVSLTNYKFEEIGKSGMYEPNSPEARDYKQFRSAARL